MAENEMCVKTMLAMCNQIIINMSKCKGNTAQDYTINTSSYESNVARCQSLIHEPFTFNRM